MKKIIIFSSLIVAMLSSISFDVHAQEKKKGLSKQGKGAIIGGAAGAVAGGLIGKSVGGAVIGGAVGAGGGYVIGNEARRRQEKRERAARIARWHKRHPNRPYPY